MGNEFIEKGIFMWLGISALVLALAAALAAFVAIDRANRLSHRFKRFEARATIGLRTLVGAYRELARQHIASKISSERAKTITFHADTAEDAFLVLLFDGKTNGVAFEAGAYDGVENSCTFTLEQLGWKGILVEARPDSVAKCKLARPNFQTIHAALMPHGSKPTTTFLMAQLDGNAARVSHLPSTKRDRKHPLDRRVKLEPVEVPTKTLGELLQAFGSPIDAVILDLEGAELGALEGLAATDPMPRPAVFLIENRPEAPDPSIGQWMRQHNYLPAGRLGLNAIFVDQAQQTLYARCQQLLYSPPQT